MISELPGTIGELERGISRLEHQLTDVALDVGRKTLPRLHREDHFTRPFVADQMDGASHHSVRLGLDDMRGLDAERLYLAGFALGWDSHPMGRTG
jgi:hypothetical protein